MGAEASLPVGREESCAWAERGGHLERSKLKAKNVPNPEMNAALSAAYAKLTAEDKVGRCRLTPGFRS